MLGTDPLGFAIDLTAERIRRQLRSQRVGLLTQDVNAITPETDEDWRSLLLDAVERVKNYDPYPAR